MRKLDNQNPEVNSRNINWVGQVAGAFVGQVLLAVAPILVNIIAEGFKRAFTDTAELGGSNATLDALFSAGMRRDKAHLHSAGNNDDKYGTGNDEDISAGQRR